MVRNQVTRNPSIIRLSANRLQVRAVVHASPPRFSSGSSQEDEDGHSLTAPTASEIIQRKDRKLYVGVKREVTRRKILVRRGVQRRRTSRSFRSIKRPEKKKEEVPHQESPSDVKLGFIYVPLEGPLLVDKDETNSLSSLESDIFQPKSSGGCDGEECAGSSDGEGDVQSPVDSLEEQRRNDEEDKPDMVTTFAEEYRKSLLRQQQQQREGVGGGFSLDDSGVVMSPSMVDSSECLETVYDFLGGQPSEGSVIRPTGWLYMKGDEGPLVGAASSASKGAEVALEKKSTLFSNSSKADAASTKEVIRKAAEEKRLSSTERKISRAKAKPLFGPEKNDQMILELKMKLRQKFQSESPPSEKRALPLEKSDSGTSVAIRREQLTKMLGGIQLGPPPPPPQPETEPLLLPSSSSTAPSAAACVVATTTTIIVEEDQSLDTLTVPSPDYSLDRQSQQEPPEASAVVEMVNSAIYDNADLCSQPETSKCWCGWTSSYQEMMWSGCRESHDPVLLPASNSNNMESLCTYCREDAAHRDLLNSWSDLESLIFAEEAQMTPASEVPLKNTSRMAPYRDDWLFWEQMALMKKSHLPEDQAKWKEAKTRRMLLWVFQGQGGSNGLYDFPWWKAKQRASIKWLLSKAYNNKVPEDLKDPFYKDHEGQEHLKPHIVHTLANAELYCLALANLYADPNFHQLNHWGVIQALARKGVYVAEPSDVQLTETVLIQTTPLRMSAHMVVMEAMMTLFIKELVTAERVVGSVRRFGPSVAPSEMPSDQEEAMLLWVNTACATLKRRIQMELEQLSAEERGEAKVHQEEKGQLGKKPPEFIIDLPKAREAVQNLKAKGEEYVCPTFPNHQDLSDLSDGVGLSSLIALYCPDELHWSEMTSGPALGMADSLYNLQLVQRFCQEGLPYDMCHLTLEDLVYMHSSIKQNVLAFMADLFNIFEVHPEKCVHLPGVEKEKIISVPLRSSHGLLSKRGLQKSMGPIPDLRTSLVSHSGSLTDLHQQWAKSPTESVGGGSEGGGGGGAASSSSSLPRRQNSVQDKERRRALQEAHSFDWSDLYPEWWWPCCHEPTTRCLYCWRGTKKPSFEELCSFHYTRGLKPSPGNSGSPLKRTHSMTQGDKAEKPYVETRSTPERSLGREQRLPGDEGEEFIIHHRRGVPTLSSVARSASPSSDEPLFAAQLRPAKEKFNMDTKAEERGEDRRTAGTSSSSSCSDMPPAGKPSNWDDQRRTSYAGRRSRRNSLSEESHLTIENFGGSQENLHLLMSRNPDKEPVVVTHIGRKATNSAGSASVGSVSVATSRSRSPSLDDERFHQEKRDLEKAVLGRGIGEDDEVDIAESLSKQIVIISDPLLEKSSAGSSGKSSLVGGVKATSFAELSKVKEQLGGSGGINIVYMQHEKEHDSATAAAVSAASSIGKAGGRRGVEKRTSFTLPAAPTTTWLQQQQQQNSHAATLGHRRDANPTSEQVPETHMMASQLHNIRLKLEERRRRIESEKKKMEVVMSRQRQKMGKAAFLQAVAKGKSPTSGSESSDTAASGEPNSIMVDSMEPVPGNKPQRPFSLQEISEDLSSVQHKWFERDGAVPFVEERKTPDIESMDLDQYQQSLAQMDTSLHELQTDIQRLSMQQQQIQQVMSGANVNHSSTAGPSEAQQQQQQQQQQPQQQQQQFFLHEQSPRRSWGQPQPMQQPMQQPMMEMDSGALYGQGTPSRRATWGQPQPVRLMMNHNQGGPVSYSAYPSEPQGFHMQPQHLDHHPHIHPPHLQQHQQQQIGFSLHQQQQHQHPAPLPSHPSLPPQPYQNGGPMGGPSDYYYSGYPYSMGYNQQQHQQQPPPYQPPPPPAPASSAPTPPPPPFRLHSSRSSSLSSSSRQSPSRGYSRECSPQPGTGGSTPAVSTTGIINSGGGVGGATSGGSVYHAPLPTPPMDDMEPQNVSFIETPQGVEQHQGERGGSGGDLPRRLQRLNISSGSKTYRVIGEAGSPPRPGITRVFSGKSEAQVPSSPHEEEEENDVKTEQLKEGTKSEHGFYISFDDSPKRPKPPLRTRKASPKKILPSPVGGLQGDDGFPEGWSAQAMNKRMMGGMLSEPPGESQEDGRGRGMEDFETDPNVDLEDMTELVPGEVEQHRKPPGVGLVIGSELSKPDPDTIDEMERKKERIMLLSLRRKQQQEEVKQQKEQESQRRREFEKAREEERARKKEEEKARRAAILQSYKMKKAVEEAEREGKILEMPEPVSAKPVPKLRSKPSSSRPRPKTIHVDNNASDVRDLSLSASRGKLMGSNNNLAEYKSPGFRRSEGRRGSNQSLTGGSLSRRGSNASLYSDVSVTPDSGKGTWSKGSRGRSRSSMSLNEDSPSRYARTLQGGHSGRRDSSLSTARASPGVRKGSYYDSWESLSGGYGRWKGSNSSLLDDSWDSRGSRIRSPSVGSHVARKSSLGGLLGNESCRSNPGSVRNKALNHPASFKGRKSNSLLNLRGAGSDQDSLGYPRFADTDSGLGRATPPRRAPSPSVGGPRHLPSPSGPGSLPLGLISRRRGFDDGASDISSAASSTMEYSGPRLYKQPTAKSNRSIILNAVEYCVFPGAVNREAKQRVLEEIARSESKHFLVLFRDAGCQFRALYAFFPEREEVSKLYGTGPKMVQDNMFDRFFKYNSGSKCFTQVHTKHLTVTIDAFTIHNSIWQGKRVVLPNKKDMALVI